MRTRQSNRLTLITLAAVALMCASPCRLHGQTLPVWGSLDPGPHAVGYRVLYELDRSRAWRTTHDSTSSQETARPIRISVWYPADVSSTGATMTLADFVRDSAPTEYFDALNQLLERRFVQMFSGVSSELYDSLLTLSLAAIEDAVPSVGSYPLVMYSPGGQASLPDNGVLAAYLASHGYVVAAVPQLENMSDGVFRGYSRRTEVQARDIEFAVGVLHDFPGVDRGRLAVMGYSLGGSVALLVARHNPNVDAVVGLDASFAYARSMRSLSESQYFDVFDLRMPILSLQAGNRESRQYSSAIVHDTLRFSDRYIGFVAETVHGDFSEYRPMLVPALVHGEGLELALVQGKRGYEASCQYIVRFLDGVLKSDEAGLAFAARSSGQNGLDVDLVEMMVRPGADTPTEMELLGLLQDHDYDVASQRVRTAQRDYPDLDVVREGAMNGLGRRLFASGDVDAAIGIFKLNIQIHDNSVRAFDGLADAYLSNGDSLLVVRTYEQLLQVLPRDSTMTQAAKDRIRQNAELRLRILRQPRPENAGASHFPG